jgi:hypothetical protein
MREARDPDKLELRIRLTKLRIREMKKEGVKPVAKPRFGTMIPTMEEIDLWKHESRKANANL